MPRQCPECTIPTPLTPYVESGISGERCIICKKMWIQQTTFERATRIDGYEPVLREQTSVPCPECKTTMRVALVDTDPPIDADQCEKCGAVWIPIVQVKNSLNLNPEKTMHIETHRYLPEELGTYIKSRFSLPELEEDPEAKNTQEKSHSYLYLVFFIVMALALKASPRDWGFLSQDPLRMGGLTTITYAFLHADLIHFAGNMFFYFMFAPRIESKIGSDGFLKLFLISVITSAATQFFFNPGNFYLIGASGVTLGLKMYYACVFPHSRIVQLKWNYFLGGYISRKSLWLFMLFQFGANAMYLYYRHGDIAYAGHLGGIIGGVLYYVMGKRPQFGSGKA